MKHNLKTYFAASALLLAGAASFTGCTSDDDFGRYPEGSIPLSIGNVGVAGVETATRAATTENASGFTGIRKTTFVNGDVLALTLSNDGGTTTTSVTATLTGGAWVLNPAKNFVIPGTTTIKAAYTPAATTGMKADLLEATTYTMDGQKVTFAMKHANAMIDITYTAGVAPTSITVTVHNGTADENLSTVLEEEADGTKHFRSIASAGTVKSLTAVINGQNYIATLATPLTVEANKRYPIALTFKENLLTATVGTATLNWNTGGAGELYPPGYDRYISTPEDLAQFAYDVNNNLNGARAAKVLQTADIDLAQLKTAAAANTANPGKNYTYTATAENWVPIAASSNTFTGTYNGNGHTISNLKGSEALFSSVGGGELTGIHLRNVQLTGAASLASTSMQSTIALCSATGSITYNGQNCCGGLIGNCGASAVITRCNADVDITVTSTSGNADYYCAGGLIGHIEDVTVTGCTASGNITASSSSISLGGLIGMFSGSTIFGCSATGNVSGSASDYAFVGQLIENGGSNTISSCYATGTATGTSNEGFGGFYAPKITYTDCAWTGTSTFAIAGVTYSVAVADLYEKITASGASSPAAVKTLHWSAADGYTTTEVSDTWHASAVWKDNGTAAPTVDMTYEGGAPLYNGQRANLLQATGYHYWVAPENAATNVTWNDVNFNTVCPAGWHVPTKEEIKTMTGLAEGVPSETNYTPVTAAFPGGYTYLTSEDNEGGDTTKTWLFSTQTGKLSLSALVKTTTNCQVRCVRKK